MAISLKAARSLIIGDISLFGDVLVYAGSTNTYTITNYSSFSTYSVSANYGTASITGDTITLDVPTPSTQNQINLSVIKDGKGSTFTVAVGASVVVKPTITSPSNGSTDISIQPTIQASASPQYLVVWEHTRVLSGK